MNDTDEWFTVSQIGVHSQRIVEGTKYGMFLVEGTERALLVDAAAGIGDLRTLVETYVDVPVTLLLTHTHWDHIGNAYQFDDVRVNGVELADDGRVKIDGLSDEFTHRPKQFASNWLDDGNEFPDGFDPDTFEIEPADATPIEAGDEIDLGDRTVELYPVPGHSPGQLAVLDREMGYLYGGDVIHTDNNIYAHFQDSDIEAYRESFERLIDLRDNGVFEALATSHNTLKTGDELEIIDDLYNGMTNILNDDLEYEVIDTNWGDAREYHIGTSRVLTPVSF